MNERLLYTVLCIFLVLSAPFWLYLPALFIGIVIFPRFWEAVAFGAFIDYYYGAHAYAGTPLAYPFALSAALLILAAGELRERTRLSH